MSPIPPWITITTTVWSVLSASPADPPDAAPRLNQIQVIGTHNSYHIAPPRRVLGLLGAGNPERAKALDYSHRPLPEQFDRLGIRQIELDVFADPQGARFAKPLMASSTDFTADPQLMTRPGFKVLHIQDIDQGSTAATFTMALKQVRDWSLAHPWHVPILVLVEVKDEPIPGLPTKPVTMDQVLFSALEEEIRATIPRERLFTPDDLRGGSTTLPEAIEKHGWPTLEQTRGKIVLALDNEGRLRDLYLEGHPALRDRLMFATVGGPEHPAAAWFKINDPIGDFDRIRDLVGRGFLVRTRADVETRQARANDTTQRDRALASGAQFISTDYPEPVLEHSLYVVRLAGGAVARWNPVSARGRTPMIELEPRAPR